MSNTRAHAAIKDVLLEGLPVLETPTNYVGRAPSLLLISKAENLTIDGLRLRNTTAGIIVEDSRNVTLRHINMSNLHDGIAVHDSDVLITDSWITTDRFGITATGTSRLTVRDTVFEGNGIAAVAGVHPGIPIDVRWNWWGAASGPNAPGGEYIIGSNAVWDPWLTQRPENAGYLARCSAVPEPCL